jgi:hypothetical protein
MSLKEDALRNARIFNSIFNDMDGVILKVEIQNAFAHAEILVAVLDNWFLEVALEVKHLYSSD